MFKTLLMLSVLVSLVISFRPATSPVVFAECNCSNLEDLQIELRNAQKLQQAFRNKIPSLRSMSHESSMLELKRFSETSARDGLEKNPKSKGASEVDFVAYGDTLYDPTRPPASATNESLCRLSSDAELSLQRAMQNVACDGIGRSLKAHEDVHQSSCVRRGYVNFFKMNGADRAEDEVAAYGAQINTLKAEIMKMIERAQVTVISDVKTKIKVPANPLYSTISVDNHSDVPMTSVSGSNDRFRFTGQGQQTNNASVDGNCRITSGVPYNLPATVTVDTDGLTADITYELSGKPPSIAMKCTIPGAGSGYGMSIPVQVETGKVPVAKMPLKDGAEIVMDMAQSEAAKIVAAGGVTMSGTATVTIKCK